LVIKRNATLTISQATTPQCVRFTTNATAIVLSPTLAEVTWRSQGSIKEHRIIVNGNTVATVAASVNSYKVPLIANGAVQSITVEVVPTDALLDVARETVQVVLSTCHCPSCSTCFEQLGD
jgi:hypothetical protein